MNRRRLLAICSSIPVVAGCTGQSTENDASPSPDTSSPTVTGTETAASNNADRKETPATCAETDGQSCPPFATARDRAVCSHTVEPNSASVYMEPNPGCSTLENGTPKDEITLTFYNQSSSDLSFNPYSWRIWHDEGGEWTELEQEVSGGGKVTVAAHDSHSWTFMEAVEAIQEEPTLESGLYGAEIGVPDPRNSDAWVACIALVQLDANN